VSAMQKDVTAVMQANYTQLAKTAASAIEQKQLSGADGNDVITGVMRNMLEQGNKVFDNMASIAGQMTEMANAQIQAAISTPAKPTGSATRTGGKR
jgi:phage-related minor tail protein